MSQKWQFMRFLFSKHLLFYTAINQNGSIPKSGFPSKKLINLSSTSYLSVSIDQQIKPIEISVLCWLVNKLWQHTCDSTSGTHRSLFVVGSKFHDQSTKMGVNFIIIFHNYLNNKKGNETLEQHKNKSEKHIIRNGAKHKMRHLRNHRKWKCLSGVP